MLRFEAVRSPAAALQIPQRMFASADILCGMSFPMIRPVPRMRRYAEDHQQHQDSTSVFAPEYNILLIHGRTNSSTEANGTWAI
jgi:hypothetical protein